MTAPIHGGPGDGGWSPGGAFPDDPGGGTGGPPPALYRSPAHEVVLELFRATDALRRTLTAVVEAEGLTLQQFNVLRILRGAGPGGLPTLEVGARMVERAPGTTRLLDRLEREGLIERSRSAADRRKVMARISLRGRERLALVDGPLARAEEALVGRLSPAEVAVLRKALPRLREAADGDPTRSPS